MEKFRVVLGFVSKLPFVVSKKAFVITSKDNFDSLGYCDFYTINVFDNKELAEKFCDEFNRKIETVLCVSCLACPFADHV